MSINEIILMAQECQLIGMRPHLDGIYEQSLVRFAALVATAEREACAKVCRTFAHEAEGWSFADAACFKKAADMIRAGGNE